MCYTSSPSDFVLVVGGGNNMGRVAFCRARILLVCLFAVVFAGSVARAQSTTGTILGVVKDSSGGVVPGANVTALATDTGQSRTVTTGQDGAFRLDAMPVGNYQLSVKATGFQTELQNGLVLNVGQEAVSNFTLQVGEVSQTVSVTAESTNLVDTTTSSLGSLVNQQQISDLPLNGRNYNDLTLLQAGVTKSLNSNNSTIGYNGTAYSSNGAPQRSNTYLLDGALQMSLSGNNGSSALGTTLGVDGILEYRVITNSFDAEYGMTMGSQMTIVSKSGSNSFHGDAFDFLRNNVLDARNYFDLPPARLGGHRNPEFRRNQFGGAFSGPIQKDKTFFFVTYEGLRALLDSTNTTTTLGTLAIPNGCHVGAGATVTSTQCPQLGAASAVVASQMANFLNLYPAPNLAGTNGGAANNYGFVFDQVTPENYGQIRIDHTISASDSLFGRYTIDDASLPFVGNFNSNNAVETSKNQFLTVGESHIFSGSLVNSARVSFTREPLIFATVFTDPRLTQTGYVLVTTPGLGMGGLSATGAGGIGDSILAPRKQKENIFTESDDVNYNKGRHSFKFGGIFNHYQYDIETHGYDRGIIGFTSVAGLLQAGVGPGTSTYIVKGVPTLEPTQTLSTFSLTLPSFDNVTKYLHFNTMGFYAQDSWKVLPRLTLNYGMRYEPTTTVNEIYGNAGTLRNFPTSSTFTVGNAVFKSPGLRNWSPRFGFAWDVFGDGKTAVRGGFDLLYDLATWGQTYMNFAGYDPPFSQNISTSTYIQTYTNFTGMQVPITIPAAGTFQNSFRGPIWNENQPHLLSYNFTVERQLPGQIGLSLAYAGSHGINLIQVLEGNNVIPNGVPSGGLCQDAASGSTINFANQYDGSATSCYLPACPIGQVAVPGNNCSSRNNPNLPSMVFNPAAGESFYNALDVTVNKRISHGVQFQAAYAWSKLNDNQQGGSGQDGNDIAAEPLHTGSLYGPALFDVRNTFHFNALYRFPDFVASKGILGKLANGWATNGILSLQSGYPFSVTLSGDRELISYTPSFANRDTPDLIPGRNNNNITSGVTAGCTGVGAGTKLGTPTLWYDPCAFSIQPQGFIGTEPRNFLRGPGLANVDFSIVKDTSVPKLGEAGQLEFRAEVFDLFNHPNFALPGQTVSAGSCPGSSIAACSISASNGAGSISQTISGTGGLPQGAQRQIQFGLKLKF
jgi:hypothetical protein